MATATLRLTRTAQGVPAVLALNPVFAYATADRKVAWQITLDDAVEGQVVRFTCRTAVAFWPVHVAAAIKPDLWISLKQH